MTAADPDNVGEYLITARSFDEYRAMFTITDADLTGAVLDCPGGGSSFTARASATGMMALAADPVYARPAKEVGRLAVAETQRGSAHTAAGADRYVWDYYGGIDGHAAIRRASAEIFATDIAARPGCYVPAALPELPFTDHRFDLVLSSHFLFTYADRLDARFHLAALRELHRVSRGEVRIFPLLEQGGRAVPRLVDKILAELDIPCCIRPVDYEFQRGGNQMLVLGAPR
jgi:Methyltransferase domain